MTSSNAKGRIIISFKATSDADRSVITAITLAKAIKRDIVGLYVLEEAMVEMAALPFTCTIEVGTAQRRKLTPQIMNKSLERGAAACRMTLSRHAQKADVNWSFNIKSGALRATLSSDVLAGDFLILSGDRHGFDGHNLLDQLHFAPSHVSGVVISPLHTTRTKTGPIIAIDDGDAAGEKTLQLAINIARTTGRKLNLLALADSTEELGRISTRATNMLPAGQNITIHHITPGATVELKAALAHLSPSFIIADMQGEPFADDKAAQILLRSARAPVVLLRS